MKILLTGGGSGGHFYPIIAVAQEINTISKENRLLRPDIYYMSTEPYNEGLLYENNITFIKVSSGKIRLHFSIGNVILNILDVGKTMWGMISGLWKVFKLYPDVVFGKGGYSSFPALFAAWVLRIPTVIHESDSIPGKVNKWAGKFAKKIALSYPQSASYFPADKTAYTGNPIRKEIQEISTVNAYETFGLDKNTQTILILGGSQGARFINEIILDCLPELVATYQIIHQTGKKNIKVVEETKDVVLQNNPHKDRYKPMGYIDVMNLRLAAGVADIVISRAGSTIFEIASWGKPSIIIPIREETAHDQRSNAFAYARSGAAEVIEEKNLSPHVLVAEINRILGDVGLKEKMSKAASGFARRDSAKLIAQEILAIAVSHEK